MVSFSLSAPLLSLALFMLLFFTLAFSQGYRHDPFKDKPVMTHHGGPILNGTLKIALIWYGNCGRVQKRTIRNFIKSLNGGGDRSRTNLQPQVSGWWNVVESYQSAVPAIAPVAGRPQPSPRIIVNVAKQFTDRSYKYGQILTTSDFIPMLIRDYTKGDTSLIPIVVTARDVTVQGICNTGKCADHGIIDNKQPYIVVGNPETECPAACGWPFHPDGPKTMVLKPPNLNMAADAMVVALATALVDTVTSPLNNGFYHGLAMDPIGPGLACKDIFGSGALPGNPGKTLIDPASGGAFNAHGNRGKKFLLPAVWNLQTSSCWTLV